MTVREPNIKFSIDLVPVINFDKSKSIASRPFPKQFDENIWNAVPKPNKARLTEDNPDWICSYVRIERKMMEKLNTFKNLIRIFKVCIPKLFTQ